ncbi:thioesterase II family protein [Umezawaea endophytica]|uniref:Alpha/beta fold hydrolase n=1 Tax=Umezawaea endophytica TaxID=1654476 RepID=A0A9X2VVU3_9PSEU|nr:alpha/beta fold hydrolase [Umezawaea endophytica]MCS7483566.1 alpha/beta fold hydrolase [Umezawaea endophytica]
MTHKLFCFPYAGGGASFYRAWPDTGLHGFEVRPVQLPGREELFIEPFHADVAAAADDLTGKIARSLGPSDQVSLFGHSFGAVLAFEVARRLVDFRPPLHLVVSGSANPVTPLPREAADLDDDQFVARVEKLAGYTHPALADPDLRDIVLPALRHDVALHESYVAQDLRPIPVPITVVRGADDHIVSRQDCEEWAVATSDRCDQVELPGGHMYLVDDPSALFDLLRRVSAGSLL